MQRIELRIDGMSCGHCVATVRGLLAAVPGVRSVDVSLEQGRAAVEADSHVRPADLLRALDGSGYDAHPGEPAPQEDPRRIPPPSQRPAAAGGEVRLSIEGMSCASCVARVERALAGVPGVGEARVNFATGRAIVRLLGEGRAAAVATAAVEAVRGAGYGATVIGSPGQVSAPGGAEGPGEVRQWLWRWIAGAVLSAPVVALEMGGHWLGHAAGVPGGEGIAFACATAVVVLLGGKFLAGAVRGLRHGTASMDLLVTLGVGAAYVSSAWVRVAEWTGVRPAGGHVYFESAAVVLTLVSLGKWLEARARLRAGQAIRSLAELGAKSATVVRGGMEVDIPPEELVPGDLMIVRPGAKVPTDGVVEEGISHLDESLLTGESMPVPKGPGDAVTGSTLNIDGLLRVRATRTGGETALARMVALVERAQEGKAAVQRMADRVAGVFVPAVMAVAAAAWGGWGWIGGDWTRGLNAAVAVLIVACPCALGLATPAALMVGMGRGARQGILIREVAAVEAAGTIDTILLDKTGTVTEGKPRVTDVIPVAAGMTAAELLSTAAGVEAGSDHPIARAIVRHAETLGAAPASMADHRSRPGLGAEASLGGRRIVVGSMAFMEGLGVTLPGPARADAERLEAAAHTIVVVAEPQAAGLLGVLGVSDPIKPASRDAVERMRVGLGAEVWLLTGDNERVAGAIAAEAGIRPDRVLASVRPEGKAEAVRRLQSAGHRVAMVGDGTNDAPALAQADLGIAMGTGTDAAMEAGAITLMSGDLMGAARAIRLSRATMVKIRQNLAWAFVYNTLLVPIAALGWLSPILAGVAMALSSVSVVANSLWLNRLDLDHD